MIKKFDKYNEGKDLEGKRVRLIKMNDDPDPIEPGTEGTIDNVDGIGTLHVNWDNGRRLGLVPDQDIYTILNEELDAVTVGLVGNGTAVSGYPTGSWTTSAGQAVYGGDSGSAFAGNSSGSKAEQEVVCPPKHIFKEVAKKKNRKDKQVRLNNQIGTDIDKLHKVTKKVTNENMKTWEEFNRLNEDEGGGYGGISSATLGNTGGMGAIVSAQPSSIPGDVAGSTKGSGDIGHPLGIFTKQPAGQPIRRKKNKKDKRDKPYHKIGAGIDNFYVTKYTETKNNGGKIIASWKTFSDTKN